MERIVVVVGDVHGCLEELDELLKTLQYKKDQMRLVFLGDLVDRGPDSAGCVRRVREIGAECIMGNHEEKWLRWRKHQKNFELTGKSNPMKPMAEEDQKAHAQLSDADFGWMKNLPLKLELDHNFWAVHAGCEPRFSLHRQVPAQIMRVRYVDEKGAAKALNSDKSQPEGTVYWSEQWKGPESIVYGHCVHIDKKVRIDYISPTVTCLGIDTGCVFGGSLTAAFLNKEHPSFVTVAAKKKYYSDSLDE
jgi:bis(5'-nucleosyl)-tetraphosphatase (symmetrical)